MAAVFMVLLRKRKCFRLFIIFIVAVLILQFFVCFIRYFKKQNIHKLCTEIKTVETRLNANENTFEETFNKLQNTKKGFKRWRWIRKNRGRMRDNPNALHWFNQVDLGIVSYHRKFSILCDSFDKVVAKQEDLRLKLEMVGTKMHYCDSMLERLDDANMFDIWFFTVPTVEWYDADVEKQFDVLMKEWDKMEVDALLDNYLLLFESFFSYPFRNGNKLKKKPVKTSTIIN